MLFEQAFQFHGKSFHRIRQMLPDKTIAQLVKYYYGWKKTRTRTSLMDRQARKLQAAREEQQQQTTAAASTTSPGLIKTADGTESAVGSLTQAAAAIGNAATASATATAVSPVGAVAAPGTAAIAASPIASVDLQEDSDADEEDKQVKRTLKKEPSEYNIGILYNSKVSLRSTFRSPNVLTAASPVT